MADADDDACRVLSPLPAAIFLPALITNFGLRLKNRPTLASVFRTQYNRNTQEGGSQNEKVGLLRNLRRYTLATSSYLPIVECVDLLQIIIDSGSPVSPTTSPPPPIPSTALGNKSTIISNWKSLKDRC